MPRKVRWIDFNYVELDIAASVDSDLIIEVDSHNDAYANLLFE